MVKSVTGRSVKNQVNIEPTRLVVSGTPFSWAMRATPLGDELGGLFESVVDVFLVVDEVAEGGDPGGHGERVAAERSGLIDGAERGEQLHDVGASAEGSAGQASADDLAEGGDVGRDAVELLGAAEGDAEAGHHLVEDQERAVGCRDLAQAFEVAGVRAGWCRRCRRRARR